MTGPLDIAEVARRTGLSSRALRFYEARGLVMPLRTASGRRSYGRVEIERLHRLLTLKKAGLSLAQIAQLLDDRPIDLRRLIESQLTTIAAQQVALADTHALLASTLSRIDRGEPIDAETFCSLIRSGENTMTANQWTSVTDTYFSPEERADWSKQMAQLPADFDQEGYSRQWHDLSARIAAALPLDPASAGAQAFVDQWFALLKPFSTVATPAMWSGTTRMYEDMGSWEGRADPGFSKEIWHFIQAATKARLAAGGTIDGPAWMTDAKG